MEPEMYQPDYLLWTIFLGVATGGATTLILYMISKMFVDWILPWHSQYIYQGISVAGEWEIDQEFEDSKEYSSLVLKQAAGKLKGELKIFKEMTKVTGKRIKIFRVEGFIQDRFISLNLRNKDKNMIGLSSMLLEAVGNGFELEGSEVWYSIEGKKIRSGEVHFKKKSEGPA
jgi:hypothetical protein